MKASQSETENITILDAPKMSTFFFPPITEKRYVDCVLCKRFVSVGQTDLLFMDGKKEIRVCGWCNY